MPHMQMLFDLTAPCVAVGQYHNLPSPLSFKTACGPSAQRDGQWLNNNLGPFAVMASYSDLKDLNVTVVKDAPPFSVAVVTGL